MRSPVGLSKTSLRSSLIVAIVAALLAVGVSACGSGGSDPTDDSSSVSSPAVPCKGKPVVLGTITSLGGPSPLKDMMGGVEAAAAAVNHDCTAGRPIKLVTCNDEGDQSRAADCGREIVNSGAIALVGSGGVASGSFETIVQGAGIPSIGNLATDVTELAAITSFPFYSGLTRIASRASLDHAAGATSTAIIVPDNPAVQALQGTMEETAGRFGIDVDQFVPVPLNATDLAQYASQADESEAIMILDDGTVEGILRELLNLGVTPEDKVISAPALSQEQIDEFGDQLNGLLMASPTVPLTDTSNEGVEQYLAETDAIGVEDHGVEGMIGWRAMHVVADVVKTLPENPTSADMKKAIEGWSFAPPEAAPVDFTKPAFPDIPLFTEFRVFSREYAAWRVEDGEIKLAVPGFVDPGKDFQLK